MTWCSGLWQKKKKKSADWQIYFKLSHIVLFSALPQLHPLRQAWAAPLNTIVSRLLVRVSPIFSRHWTTSNGGETTEALSCTEGVLMSSLLQPTSPRWFPILPCWHPPKLHRSTPELLSNCNVTLTPWWWCVEGPGWCFQRHTRRARYSSIVQNVLSVSSSRAATRLRLL